MNKRNRPVAITDAPEHRSIPIGRVELRADSGSNTLTLTGYASTFEPYEMYGGPAAGGWIEQLAPTAFNKTLREKPDLHLLINHEGMPLARTKSGTLQLSVDKHGLKVTAQLDRDDPDVQRLETKMKRGDMDEMSFAFRVKAQSWSATDDFPDDMYALRTLNEVSLHKGDVSVVNFGANPTTHAELKHAVRMIATADEDGLAEAVAESRARGDGNVQRAIAALATAETRRLPGNKRAASAARGDAIGAVYTGPLDDVTVAALAMAESSRTGAAVPAAEPEKPAAEGAEEAGEGDEGGGERAEGGEAPKRKPLTRAEALRKVGLAAEDGKPMSRADAEALVAAEQPDIDAMRSAEYATRYADLMARLAPA